jgi:hypothetical protein
MFMGKNHINLALLFASILNFLQANFFLPKYKLQANG